MGTSLRDLFRHRHRGAAPSSTVAAVGHSACPSCTTCGLQRTARGRTFKRSTRPRKGMSPMAQAPTLDFEAFIAKRKGERVGGGAETSGHEYAYIMDRQTRAAFERAKPVELAVA